MRWIFTAKVFWVILAVALTALILLLLRGVWMTMRLRGKTLEQKLQAVRAMKQSGGKPTISFSHLLNESKILNQLGRPQEALDVLKTADAPAQMKIQYYLARAEAYIGLNRLSDAKKMLAAAGGDKNITTASLSFERDLVMGKLCLALKDAEGAGKCLEKTRVIGYKNPYRELMAAQYLLLIKDNAAAAEKTRLLRTSKDEYIARQAKALLEAIENAE